MDSLVMNTMKKKKSLLHIVGLFSIILCFFFATSCSTTKHTYVKDDKAPGYQKKRGNKPKWTTTTNTKTKYVKRGNKSKKQHY